MDHHCSDHTELVGDTREIKNDVKWLVINAKESSRVLSLHLAEADKRDAAIKVNSTWIKAGRWAIGLLMIVVGWAVLKG